MSDNQYMTEAARQASEILRIPAPVLEQPEWESKIDLIRRTVAAGATHDELEAFLYQCKRAGLDPLLKQIYYVKRKGKGVVQVGIDGLRLIADRTGSDDAIFEGQNERGFPAKAKVTVYKMVQGQRCPFSATARWDEYFPGDDQGFQWRKMPHAMLSKCAEALALRKAFPADTSGLYIHEEMDQADVPPMEISRAVPPGLDPSKLIGEEEPAIPNPPYDPRAETQRQERATDGKNAFGYTPVRWPLPKMFQDPMTDSQAKMMANKARERGLPEEDLPTIRRLVLASYGIEEDASKAAASLFLDFLINADEEHLELAARAAEAADEQEPLGLE